MNARSLRVVRPLVITPGMLVECNVPEADYPEWAAGTSYALGARVIVLAEHAVYESVAADNVGNVPASSLQWSKVGTTNRWKSLDKVVSTQTQRPGLIRYRIKAGVSVQAVSALNLTEAESIRVSVTDPHLGLIYDRTVPLAGHMIDSSWWDWFFGPRTVDRQTTFVDLPSAPDAEILIEIAGSDGLAVGVLILGQMRTFSLGIKANARVGIQDFSRKERDEWGETVLVERAFARRASFSAFLKASEVDELNDFLTEVRATSCLWIGSDRYEATTVYGFWKSFDIVLAYTDYSDCELDLEGLT